MLHIHILFIFFNINIVGENCTYNIGLQYWGYNMLKLPPNMMKLLPIIYYL